MSSIRDQKDLDFTAIFDTSNKYDLKQLDNLLMSSYFSPVKL